MRAHPAAWTALLALLTLTGVGGAADNFWLFRVWCG